MCRPQRLSGAPAKFTRLSVPIFCSHDLPIATHGQIAPTGVRVFSSVASVFHDFVSRSGRLLLVHTRREGVWNGFLAKGWIPCSSRCLVQAILGACEWTARRLTRWICQRKESSDETVSHRGISGPGGTGHGGERSWAKRFPKFFGSVDTTGSACVPCLRVRAAEDSGPQDGRATSGQHPAPTRQ